MTLSPLPPPESVALFVIAAAAFGIAVYRERRRTR